MRPTDSDFRAALRSHGTRVERYRHAPVAHERAVVGNRVINLELVSPPIRETRCARAVRRDFVGDLVAFEHVLERADAHAETFHRAQERENFVLPVAVAMNQPFALDDFADGFELEVAA